jgi:uncharacterized protein YkwD
MRIYSTEINRTMQKIKYIFILAAAILDCGFSVPSVLAAPPLAGRIVIRVEKRGEAAYVAPDGKMRYPLSNAGEAFEVFKKLAKGIKKAELEKFPVGSAQDNAAAAKELPAGLSGRFFLSVEERGEIWYINPADRKRYIVSRQEDAMKFIRATGLGVRENAIIKIPEVMTDYGLSGLEKKVADAVNGERIKSGLKPLAWNSDLASVAREHSANLARENKELVSPDKRCDFPMIHHEGSDFGLYQQDRLKNRGLDYMSRSAENIALIPLFAERRFSVASKDKKNFENLEDCEKLQRDSSVKLKNNLDSLPKPGETMADKEKISAEKAKLAAISSEIQTRKAMLGKEPAVFFETGAKRSNLELVSESVNGWMASPGHRANILNSELDEAGIGAAVVGDYLIITQVFIHRALCGFEGAVCCSEEGYLPYCFKPLECEAGFCRK